MPVATTRRNAMFCPANLTVCPHQQCGATLSSRLSVRHRIANARQRRTGIQTCPACQQKHFWHASDGGAVTWELYPGEAEHLNIDAPLPEIWRQLGVMAVA